MDAIRMTEAARRHIASRYAALSPKGRLPRIVLLQKSCSGARFGLFFDKAEEDDIHLSCQDISFLAKPILLEQYGGFDLDLERFFFAPRVLITPHANSRLCDCDTKCNRYNEET